MRCNFGRDSSAIFVAICCTFTQISAKNHEVSTGKSRQNRTEIATSLRHRLSSQAQNLRDQSCFEKCENNCTCKAWFTRRTLHELNLIILFSECKDRRMNQLGSTDLYLGRPAVLFDCASRIERQKFDFDSDVELLHDGAEPNKMHTLRINYINYIYPRGRRVPSIWHAQRYHSEQDGGKSGMCLFLLFQNN